MFRISMSTIKFFWKKQTIHLDASSQVEIFKYFVIKQLSRVKIVLNYSIKFEKKRKEKF